MSCVLKCDLCGMIEYDVEIKEYVDEQIKDGLLRDWNLSKPIEHLCEDCVKRINENFEEPVLFVSKNHIRLTYYGKESNK